MNRHLLCVSALAFGLALPAVGAAQSVTPAYAPEQTQSQPAPATPGRQANIWNWRHHQPTEARVQQNERAAGVALSPAQQQSSAATVDHLDRQLLKRP